MGAADWIFNKIEALVFPQGIVLEGRFSRLERFRSDHPMEELYEAFVRKQDESRWTYLPYGPFENF